MSGDLSWFKYSWATSCLSLSFMVESKLHYTLLLCFHIWARTWQGNDMLREPPSPPAVATPWICHALDNNVLRPQACSNTCWRDQLLGNACNNRNSRIQVCPEYWLTLLPLFPGRFPPLAQTTPYLRISFSFYSLSFPCSSVFTLASLWLWQAETWLIQISCTHTHRGQWQSLHVTQLCEMCAVF